MILHNNIKIVTQNPARYEAMGWTAFEGCHTALASLEFLGELSLDTESTGLGSALLEHLHCVQIGLPNVVYIFDNTIPISVLKRPLEEKLLILQNAGWDLPLLMVQDIYPSKVYCTLTAEYCLTRGMQYVKGYRGLEALAERYCGVKMDKSKQSTIAQGLNSVEDIVYAGQDPMPLAMIKEEQEKVAAARGMTEHIRIQCQFNLFMAWMEVSGMPMDIEALYEYIREAEAEEWNSLKKLKAHKDINWRSPQQVGEILKEYGIEETNEETGNLLTGVEVLNKYAEIPLISDLLEFRALAKKVTAYGRKWFHYLIDGKIHTRYRQFTDTGRTSCGATDRKKFEPWDVTYTTHAKFPNLQQIPADFKKLFKTPKGWKFIAADYTGQESVILADQSEEANMLTLFREGRDMHSFVARQVYDDLKELDDDTIKEEHKDRRTLIKRGTFSIAYGGNGQTIADNLNIDKAKGDEIYDGYMKAFPGLNGFFKHCFEYTGNRGYIPLDRFGGKRYFNKGREFKDKFADKAYWRKYYDERKQDSAWYRRAKDEVMWYHLMAKDIRKLAVNSRIQGTGASMSKIACNLFYQYVHANKLFSKVRAGVMEHDAVVIWSVDKLADKMKTILESCMKKAGELCLTHLKIQAEGKISDVWPK